LALREEFDSFGALKAIALSMKWQSSSVDSSPIFGTPALLLGSSSEPTPLLVFGTVGGTMECVSVEDGAPLWSYNATPHHLSRSPFFSSPCLVTTSLGSSSNFLVIGSHDGWVRFVDPKTGTLKSEANVGAVVYGSLTWMKRGDRESIVACTTAGEVCVLEWVASDETWVLRSRLVLKGEIYASPTIVNTLDLQGILVGCRDDCVHYLSLNN
jgi:outer membrane protein assembly factor BamB